MTQGRNSTLIWWQWDRTEAAWMRLWMVVTGGRYLHGSSVGNLGVGVTHLGREWEKGAVRLREHIG